MPGDNNSSVSLKGSGGCIRKSIKARRTSRQWAGVPVVWRDRQRKRHGPPPPSFTTDNITTWIRPFSGISNFQTKSRRESKGDDEEPLPIGLELDRGGSMHDAALDVESKGEPVPNAPLKRSGSTPPLMPRNDTHKLLTLIKTVAIIKTYTRDRESCCDSEWIAEVAGVLLSLLLLVIGFTLNCTAILDAIFQAKGTNRRYMQITPNMAVFIGLLTCLGFAHNLWVLVRITCMHDGEARAARKGALGLRSGFKLNISHHQSARTVEDCGDSSTADTATARRKVRWASSCCMCVKHAFFWVRWHLSPWHPNFHKYETFFEVCTNVLQLLALKEYSYAGMAPSWLITYAIILFINALVFTCLQFFAAKATNRRSMILLAKYIVIADAIFNVIISFFPFAWVLLREVLPLVGKGNKHELCSGLAALSMDNVPCLTFRSIVLIEFGKTLLWGGSVWDTFLKLTTRLAPVVLAVIRIREAVQLKYFGMAVAAEEKEKEEAEEGEKEEGEKQPLPSSSEAGQHSDEQLLQEGAAASEEEAHTFLFLKNKLHDGVASIKEVGQGVSFLVQGLGSAQSLLEVSRSLSYRPPENRKNYYNGVPVASLLLFFCGMSITCFVVIISLATWPACDIPRYEQSCFRPVTPFISRLWGEKGAACSCSIWLRSSDCQDGLARNGANNNNTPSTQIRAAVPESLHGKVNYLALTLCSATAADVEYAFGAIDARRVSAVILNDKSPGSAPVSLRPSALTRLVKLQFLYIHNLNLGHLNESVLEANSELLGVMFWNTGLAGIPPGLFKNQHKLISLVLNWNRLRGLPSEMFDHVNMSDIRDVWMYGNEIAALPTAMPPFMDRLTINDNRLTELPHFVVENRFLGVVDLSDNMIASLDRLVNAKGGQVAIANGGVGGTTNKTVLMLGGNPVCESKDAMEQARDAVGPVWHLTCVRHCAKRCLSIAWKNVHSSRISDGQCQKACNTSTCGWDGGDCI